MTHTRPLTEAEVEFEVSIEPETITYVGNVMASGDDDFDRECEQEIATRLDRGEVEAWCILTVRATWGNYTGIATLGGCSFAPCRPPDAGTKCAEQAEEMARDHEMHELALDDLNRTIALSFYELLALRDTVSP